LFVGLVGVARKDSGASTGGEVYGKMGWFVGENVNRKAPDFMVKTMVSCRISQTNRWKKRENLQETPIFNGKNPWVSG
jgi:hypothetical protein